MICPHCKKENYNENALVCAYCSMPMYDAPNTANSIAEPSNSQPAYPQKICPVCGNSCYCDAAICVRCGAMFDEPSVAVKVLSFLFPVLGFILYFVERSTKPVSASAYGKMAFISVLIGVGIQVVFWGAVIIIGVIV